MKGDSKIGFYQRRYLVDKRFQMKYTLMIVSFSAVIYGILGYFLYQKERTNSEILEIQNLELSRMIDAQDVYIIYYLAAFFLIQVASLFVLGILITHRIAGPVHRVHRYLEEVAETGRVRPLEPIRSRDEFHEFFQSLGAVIERLSTRDSKLRELAAEVNLLSAGDPARVERVKSLLEQIVTPR